MAGKIHQIHFRIFLAIALLAIQSTLVGQNYHFTYYTGNDGLPTDLIKSVAITPDGFIALATDEGFVVYDGQTFRTYTSQLQSRYAKFVFTEPSGRMLVSDDMGLTAVTFEGILPKFQLIKRGSIERNDTALWYPKIITADALGNTWVTDNSSIYLLKGNTLNPLPIGMKSLPENVQRSFMLADDSTGNLYAFYDGGNSYLIDRNNLKIRETTGFLPEKAFFYAAPLSKGKIWVAGNSGLWIVDTRTNNLTPKCNLVVPLIEFSGIVKLRHNLFIGATWSNGIYEIKINGDDISYRKIEQFLSGNVNFLSTDKEGNIWLAGDNGLVLMSIGMFQNPLHEQLNGYIQHITTKGHEVFATDGKQVLKINHHTGEFSYSTLYTHRGKETILRLLAVEGGIWMSDNMGNIGFKPNTGPVQWIKTGQSGAVFILAPGLNDEMWFCQDGMNKIGCIDQQRNITFYGQENGIDSRIISIVRSPDGKSLFLGGSSDEGYLYQFDLKQRIATNLSQPVGFRHNIPIAVNDIAFKDKKLLLASNFGLLEHSPDTIRRIETGQLTESTIKGITIDKNGTPWFTASLGIVKLEGNNSYIFAEREGIPSKTASFRSIVVDANNHIWSGTISGLAFCDNQSKARELPSPVFEEAELDGNPFPWIEKGINTFTNKSFLKLIYTTPAFPGNLIQYQYRLISEASTTQWETCDNTLELHMKAWQPGNYKLEIRAKKEGNFTWSPPLTLNMLIKKVWYENVLIVSLIVAGILTLITLLVRSNNHRHQNRRRKLEEEIEKRTSEIRSQKNFIENQRNSIMMQNQELERKNVELTEARQKAEEFARSRTMFLSTMSHELRTPLNAVIGMTYILLNEDPRPNQIDNLQTLRFSAENLLALINDILDFSKIEAGKLSFEDVDFDLHEKISSIAQVLKVKADEKGVAISQNIEAGVPQFLVGDSTRLNQILFNIAGNAVKFTHEGSIFISVENYDVTDTHHILRFVVKDTGIGIAPDKIATIFDSFTQAENEITRKYGGTGLGLAITKKLVELQGGHIKVDSTPGQGTTFTIEMTFRKSEKNLKADEPILIDTFRQFNHERILVVDDNQINLIVARKFLTKWDLQVDTAENGVEAYELARSNQYRMILMDIQMPEMDGYTASKAIRQYETQIGRPLTPIVALTASALLDVKEKIISSGMNDFITKPFNPKELNYKIGKILTAGNPNINPVNT